MGTTVYRSPVSGQNQQNILGMIIQLHTLTEDTSEIEICQNTVNQATLGAWSLLELT